MNDPKREAARWLDQARDDLRFAEYALKGGFFAQTCFVAQQAAEKALKAVCYADGARNVLGHSVVGLVNTLRPKYAGVKRVGDIAAELDLYYIPTRYPNGLAEGTPQGAFTAAQAKSAVRGAEEVLEAAEEMVSSKRP